jgi:hypothetical protein
VVCVRTAGRMDCAGPTRQGQLATTRPGSTAAIARARPTAPLAYISAETAGLGCSRVPLSFSLCWNYSVVSSPTTPPFPSSVKGISLTQSPSPTPFPLPVSFRRLYLPENSASLACLSIWCPSQPQRHPAGVSVILLIRVPASSWIPEARRHRHGHNALAAEKPASSCSLPRRRRQAEKVTNRSKRP